MEMAQYAKGKLWIMTQTYENAGNHEQTFATQTKTVYLLLCRDWNAPNVGLTFRMLLGPDIEHIVNEVFHVDDAEWKEVRSHEGCGGEHDEDCEDQSKRIVGSATTGARIEWPALFVLLAKANQQVKADQSVEFKRARVTKASEHSPYLKAVLDGVEIEGKHHGRYNPKVSAQGANESEAEPVLCNDG